MPRLFEWKGYKFYFYANEGNPPEPAHIHIRKNRNVAKFWLFPEIYLSSSWSMTSKELNILEKVVIDNQNKLLEAYNEYFN